MLLRLFLLALITSVSFNIFSQSNVPSNASKAPAGSALLADQPTSPGAINSVRTWEPQYGIESPTTVSSASNVAEVHMSTQYMDGLGRPLQTVSWKTTPSQTDIIAPQCYDEFGREALKYLPYASTANTGGFTTNPFSDQHSFYTNTYPLEQPALTGEQYFYSKSVFEASPLNRVTKSFASGNSWAGSEGGSNEHAVNVEYLINGPNDNVRIWNIGFSETFESNVPTSPAAYNSGELYKTVTKDETGNAVVEFKDKEGYVVLKKVQIGVVSSPYEGQDDKVK